jgi:hypothetical protein
MNRFVGWYFIVVIMLVVAWNVLLQMPASPPYARTWQRPDQFTHVLDAMMTLNPTSPGQAFDQIQADFKVDVKTPFLAADNEMTPDLRSAILCLREAMRYLKQARMNLYYDHLRQQLLALR